MLQVALGMAAKILSPVNSTDNQNRQASEEIPSEAGGVTVQMSTGS